MNAAPPSGLRLGAALAAVFLVAACASTGGLAPRAKPGHAASLQADRSLEGAQLTPAAWPAEDWWRRFGDPQLNALIDEALVQSAAIGIARARLDRAAALAVAERRRGSGAGFLEAFLVGFEVECKIAEAIDPEHYNRGFHSTGTIGTFGAAAAAAKLMRMPAPQVRHMLTIASSMSSGVRVNFGSMTKPLHAARAAENGVVAAELASRGFTGGDDGLDGQWGFFQVFGGGADLDRLIPVLGRPYTMVNPGSSFKPYPCGSLSHPTMDAMLKAVVDHDLKPEQVRAVRVRAGSNVLDPLRYKIATNELEAKFCLPFLMASLLLRRKAGVREFTDEFVRSAPVQQTMPRVTNVFDAAIEARGFDKIRSIVEIDLVDGRTIVQAADERYRGGPDKPFTQAELHDKFTDCAQLTLPQARISRAIEEIEAVDRLRDIGELVSALRT